MLHYTFVGKDSEVGYYYIGETVWNVRGEVPQCTGNESRIDECQVSKMPECYPVLVDCGSNSFSESDSSGGVAAAVTVPLLLLFSGVGVCATIFIVFFTRRRRKLKQKQDARYAQCTT